MWYFLLAFALFSSPIFSWFPTCDAFVVQGEFLYFAPSYDDTYFVINGAGPDGSGAPTPRGKKVNNPVGYHPGFRLEGIYSTCNCCVDLRIRWTHVHAKSTETVSDFDAANPQLWPTQVIPNLPNVSEPFAGRATSNIDIMYQKAEILLNEKAWDLQCVHFTLRQGIEWSYIRCTETIEYLETGIPRSEELKLHGHTKGLGPQFGIIALCDLCRLCRFLPRNLSFIALNTVSLIVANSKAKIVAVDVLGGNNKVNDTSFWRLVPEWAVRFGFNYGACLFSHPLSFEVGYELIAYCNGVSKMRFQEASSPGLSSNQFYNFAVHGLYGYLAMCF